MLADFRPWYVDAFRKNENLLHRIAAGVEVPSVENQQASIGLICLKLIELGVMALAAAENDAAKGIFARGAETTGRAVELYGASEDRDEFSLDRPSIAIAAGMGKLLEPGARWPAYEFPFLAFPRFLELDGEDEDEKAVAILIWTLNAIREGRPSEAAAASRWKCRTKELREELDLARQAAQQGVVGDARARFNRLRARWADPRLTTDGFGANYRLAIHFSMVWLMSSPAGSSVASQSVLEKLLVP